MSSSHIIISASNIFFLYFAPELDAKFALAHYKHGGKAPVTISKGWLIIIFKCLFKNFGHAALLEGSQFHYQELNPGHGSESAEF